MLAIGKPGKPPKEWPEWPSWWSAEMIMEAQKGNFPKEYDLRWEFHKFKDQGQKISKATNYAVSSTEINNNLKLGSPQIFISNMYQFSMLREVYGNNIVFIYLYRLSSAEDTADWYRRVNPDPLDAQARIEEIRSVHECYMEKISEFDHVLLNTTTHPEDLYDQIFQLVEYYYSLK